MLVARAVQGKRRGPIIFAFAFLLLSTSCGTVADQPSTRIDNNPRPEEALVLAVKGKPGGSLVYPMAGEPLSFNFVNVSDTRTQLMTGLISTTLLEFDKHKQEVSSGVMHDWKVSPDARKVTLTLRNGVLFSDGVPVSADDIVFTFEKIYEPGSRNILHDSLLVQGKPLQAVKVDRRTVDILFPAPYAAAAFILTTIPILPKHAMSQEDKLIEDYWGLDTPPEKIVSLGPFVLAEHQPGRRTVYRNNPNYWKYDANGVRLPYLDELIVPYVVDRNSQVLRFQAGEVDILDTQLRPDDYFQIERTTKDAQLFNAGAANNLILCWFNQSTGASPDSGSPYVAPEKKLWFFNRSFRQAVSLSISRESIVQNVFLGLARPTETMIPRSIPAWHYEAPQRPHDLEAAKALLREAGFSWRQEQEGEQLIDPRGRPVKFSISVRSDDFWTKVAAIIQQDLEKIGMDVSIKPEDFRSLISRITHSRDYDMALLSLDIPFDPADHALLFSYSGMHFWNPGQAQPATEWEKRVDELMIRQMTALSLEERKRHYGEVQKLIHENLPFIPLANKDVLVAANKKVKNVQPVNLNPYSLWNVWEIWVE